ncbi:GNAT family N-acetyltransferase [Streptomyces sp. NPDC052610]|uniref:GNAT family N-acetyltransferase n=1 Tax=Streptomyces sp. NPDC052610 TaxID=3154952 RepID=UPI003442ADDB
MTRTPTALTWTFTSDLGAFLHRAETFLRSRPALHTVPLTVTDALRRDGLGLYGDEPPVFGVLQQDGAVRAACFRTPPHRPYLTALGPAGADALAAHLADEGRPLPGVFADHATAAAFAGAWHRRTGVLADLVERKRLYRLDTLTVPHPAPPGRPRVATAGDREQVARWYAEFHATTGGSPGRDPGAWADARIAHGGVTFWETPDGTPVSLAGLLPMVAGQVRVAPVYTPEPLRGHGYAGAVTAEVSRAARAQGAREVLLFTDLANRTSNGLYQRIGYRAVADFAVYDFA